MNDLKEIISNGLADSGFKLVDTNRKNVYCKAIFKKQTLNINRSVAIATVGQSPIEIAPFVKAVKRECAFSCGFFPYFYGVGIQLILKSTTDFHPPIELKQMVDLYDNQWSIIQSVFYVTKDNRLISEARTWGQFATGKYQDKIAGLFPRLEQQQSMR